ncbi:hypothetical protein MCOR04_008876 [Pyricularia oryzae]|nr:hypothetical protein MCOR04_008876 [Pyricularia oryzae]
MSRAFAKSSTPSLTPISPPFQFTPVQITAEKEEQAMQKKAASQDSDKPFSHPVFTSSLLNTTAAALFEAFSVLSREKIERLRAAHPQNLTEEVQKALDWIFQHALCFGQGDGWVQLV